MHKDLLAPPKFTVRRYAGLAVAWTLLAIAGGAVLAMTGTISAGALAMRAAAVAGLGAGQVWVYAALLRRAGRMRPERMPLIHGAAMLIGLSAVMLGVSIMGRGTIFGRMFAQNWWQPPAMFGLALAAGGVARRVGDSLHCPRCEYEFKFDDPEGAPIRCPECGTGWLGLLRKGRRVVSPRMIAAGGAITFFFVVVAQPVFYMRWLAPHLPTPLLFASLYASPKTWFTAWDELASRPLDAWSVRSMGERVLRLRQIDQYDSSPSKWFESMAAAGKMPPDLAERFYREGFEAELVVPDRVNAGERITALLRVKRCANGFALNPGLFFAGYSAGEQRGRREGRTLWAYQLRPDVFATHRDAEAWDFYNHEPGEVRVRVEYWLVYLPSFMEQLSWLPDGTPARPANAAWFERVTLEKTVRVE